LFGVGDEPLLDPSQAYSLGARAGAILVARQPVEGSRKNKFNE
jgi:hypothetical protein